MTHDNAVEDAFHLREWDERDEGIKFPRNHTSNLYHFRFSDDYLNRKQQNKVQLVETVAENQQNYSTEQCEHARVARRLHHALGAPGPDKLAIINKTN